MDTLVTTDWLARSLDQPDIAIVDCSAFMPTDGRDPRCRVLGGAYPRCALPRHQCRFRPVQPGPAYAAIRRAISGGR